MKEQIGFCQFCDRFRDMDRKEQFSYKGKKALFEYLEQLEEDLDEEIELDVIALCCDFTEYEDLAEFQNEHGKEYESIEDIEDSTIVIKIDNDSFIIQAY